MARTLASWYCRWAESKFSRYFLSLIYGSQTSVMELDCCAEAGARLFDTPEQFDQRRVIQ